MRYAWLVDVLRFKQALGRLKDLEDIEAIQRRSPRYAPGPACAHGKPASTGLVVTVVENHWSCELPSWPVTIACRALCQSVGGDCSTK